MNDDELLKRTLGYRFTGHAKAKVRERAFSAREVLLTIADPEQTWDGRDGKTHQRGHLAVVTRGREVITVLLRRQEQWTDADCREVRP